MDQTIEREDPRRPVLAQGITRTAPVWIGDGAWLGENVVVGPGVRIGARESRSSTAGPPARLADGIRLTNRRCR